MYLLLQLINLILIGIFNNAENYEFIFVQALWIKKLDEYQERFDKLDSMEVNEHSRLTPLKNDEVLGYHGNFKKLDVD